MVSDPYQVLGIARGATADEIKKAYRQKAKECHPDLHPDDPRATEKMNEVNEAYDMLMHPEKYQGSAQSSGNPYGQRPQGNPYGGYGGYGGYSSYGSQGGGQTGGWYGFDDWFGFGSARRSSAVPQPEPMAADSADVRAAVQAIRAGMWNSAIMKLAQIPAMNRDARWHYLNALAQYGAGNTMTALEEISRAVQMEPNNSLYRHIMQQYSQAGQAYDQRSQGFNIHAMDPSRWCLRICLLNLLCNACCRCL